MGLGDQISRIIIDVKAETKGARQQLGELNQALEAMGKIAAFAREAIQEYGEHTRLASASAGINIEKLSASFRGLINEHDLLTFASRTSHGAFKLTQAEMLKVGEAAVALRNRGFDLNEAVKKLTDSLVKGSVGGLDDFGLSVENADTKAGRLKNIMGELDRVVKENGASTTDYADDVTRLANEWDNAAAALKRYTVEALKGMPVGGKGGLFDQANDAIARGQGDADSYDEIKRRALQGGSADVTSTALNAFDAERARASMAQAQANLLKGIETGKENILDRYKLDPGAQKKADDAAAAAAKKAAEEAARLAEEYRKLGLALLGVESITDRAIRQGAEMRAGQQAQSDLISQLESDYDMQGQKRYALEIEQLNRYLDEGRLSWEAYGLARQKAFEAAGGKGVASSDFNRPGVDFGSTRSDMAQVRDVIAQMQEELANQKKARQQSFLEGAFGKLEDFNAYATAFGMLTGSVTSAMDAWIDGSMGAGEAIKKFLAGAMKGLATSMAVEALKHGAYAIGSLAFGDLRGAASHGTAAAMFGAGAAAAAVAARELGGSGSASAGGGRDHRGGGASTGGGSGRSDGVSSPGSGAHDSEGLRKESVVIVYADPFADGSPTQRRQNAERFAQRALSQSSARR